MSSAAVPARRLCYEEGHGFCSTNRASFGKGTALCSTNRASCGKGTASAVPPEPNTNAGL